eukprot:5928634-Pleurochrysis_carterae.AAC.2
MLWGCCRCISPHHCALSQCSILTISSPLPSTWRKAPGYVHLAAAAAATEAAAAATHVRAADLFKDGREFYFTYRRSASVRTSIVPYHMIHHKHMSSPSYGYIKHQISVRI